MTKSMQIDPKSQGLFGALADSQINAISAHWAALVRRPEAGVLISTRDAAAELLQIQIYARRNFSGDRKIEGPPSLVSAAGMSSAHESPVLTRCWPIRRAVSVRLRKGMSARRAMAYPSRY